MKISKSLFLAFASLGLFACSNEEITDNGGVQGEGSISVKISDPALSRAAVNYTSGTEVTLNTIKLVLTAQTGGGDKTFTIGKNDEGGDLDGGETRDAFLKRVQEFQFTGVRNPSKMEVYINTEKSSEWTPGEYMGAGLAEPLYDSSTTFVNKGDTDGDKITEYQVSLAPAHTMARLEFGGIAHVDTKDPCMFKTITIDGVILDEVASVAQVEVWTPDNLMSNTIGANFITEATGSAEDGWTPSWPAEGKCYAYNIAPVTTGKLPVLKVCFSGIEVNTDLSEYSGVAWGNAEGKGYATVKNYKLAAESAGYADAFGVDVKGNITKFPAGYIYQVKSLAIPDEAIGQGWQGGEDIHVIAEVTVSPWIIAEGTVEWN